MIKETLKQIADAKAKLESLEKKAAEEKAKKLRDLHKDLGYESRSELISALQSLEGGKGKRGGRGRKTVTRKRAAGAKKRAKRTRITDDLKKQVIEAVQGGEKGTEVAKRFGISVPSLQNIKKEAGLTKPRK